MKELNGSQDLSRDTQLVEQARDRLTAEGRSHCSVKELSQLLGVSLLQADRLVPELQETGFLSLAREAAGYAVLGKAPAGDPGTSAAMPAASLEPAAAEAAAPVADLEQPHPAEAGPAVPLSRVEVNAGLRVDPELRDLIPPLRSEERASLEESLRKEGCRDPVVVQAGTGIVLDGHNRYQICRDLGLPYKVVEIALPDQLEAKIWILNNQMGRRNLSDDQRAMIVAQRLKILAEVANRERAAKAGKARADTALREPDGRMGKSSSPDAAAAKLGARRAKQKGRPRKDSRAAAAKTARVSERKIRQAQKVRTESPELARQVEAGTLPLREAVRKVQGRRAAKPKTPAPASGGLGAGDPPAVGQGLFDALEADLARLSVAEVVQSALAAPGAAERAGRLVESMRIAADQLEALVHPAEPQTPVEERTGQDPMMASPAQEVSDE